MPGPCHHSSLYLWMIAMKPQQYQQFLDLCSRLSRCYRIGLAIVAKTATRASKDNSISRTHHSPYWSLTLGTLPSATIASSSIIGQGSRSPCHLLHTLHASSSSYHILFCTLLFPLPQAVGYRHSRLFLCPLYFLFLFIFYLPFLFIYVRSIFGNRIRTAAHQVRI